MKKYTFPNDKHLEEVVDIVYEKIEDAEIWIPYGEVFAITNPNDRISINVSEDLWNEKRRESD